MRKSLCVFCTRTFPTRVHKYEVDAGDQDRAGFVIPDLAGQQKQDRCLKANVNLI